MSKEFVERRDGSFYVIGSRVPLVDLVREFQHGGSPEAIRSHYPTLNLEQVYGAITFYLGHKRDVENDIAERAPEEKPRLIDVDAASFETLPCCGIKSATHPGRQEKRCWLQANAEYGLRAKTLLAPDGQPSGYIEYLPGEFAWRGVEARGYMFIHCVWIYSRQHQRKGWGSIMVESCLDDARAAGMHGAAVMVRDGPWLADRRLFLANGFEPVDSVPPDYQLLVRKFDRRAVNAAFKKGWEQKIEQYSRGLTIIRSSQCPHIAKFAAEIAETA